MSTPARRPDVMPASIRIPAGLQVYTHQTPEERPCHSAWAQHTCSCGAYALTWDTTAVAPSRSPHARAIDQTGVPDHPELTFAKSSRIFDLVPDNQGIIAILAEAIEGPYRFAHHAFSPYVTVGPSTPDRPMTIEATDRLQLKGGHARRQLKGLEDTITFAVMLGGPESLVEVGSTSLVTRPRPVVPFMPRPAPLPQSLAIPPAPLKTPPPLIVAPGAPPPADAPIPELLVAVCHAEELHPELGDYLVIPTGSVPEAEPLPRWVVRSPLVEKIRVVKPRLDVDRPLGEDDARRDS